MWEFDSPSGHTRDMENKLICNNKYGFKNQTIALPVSIENLAGEIEMDGNILVVKPSFHVSLVCIGEIIKKHNIAIPDFENKIIADFCEFTETQDVKFLRYTNKFKFAARDDLKTIIVMCDVSNLDTFFDLINTKYSLNVEYPPTHVTLYTLPSKPGIFLSDSSDIEKFTSDIENPSGHVL